MIIALAKYIAKKITILGLSQDWFISFLSKVVRVGNTVIQQHKAHIHLTPEKETGLDRFGVLTLVKRLVQFFHLYIFTFLNLQSKNYEKVINTNTPTRRFHRKFHRNQNI